MISFENYPQSGNRKTLLYVLGAVVLLFVVYQLYQAWATGSMKNLIDWPWTGYGPVAAGHADADPASHAQKPQSGAKMDAGAGDGYGYDANADWEFGHSAHVGTDGVEGRDPSNDVQGYDKHVNPLDGKTYYHPKTMQTPQDYLTEEEHDFIVDRHTLGYNKCRLDWLTTPSYIKNADFWFGQIWPNDNKAPLSNLRGGCVKADDIIHHGIFRSEGKFGEHPACEDKGCVY